MDVGGVCEPSSEEISLFSRPIRCSVEKARQHMREARDIKTCSTYTNSSQSLTESHGCVEPLINPKGPALDECSTSRPKTSDYSRR